ncbi:MAG: hypothetical protein ACJA17_000823 [Polaribacter sp.]|jgi:uncharacterized protein YndB with AHSA1/START domain
MKTIKVILIIISILVLAFLGTGIVIQKTNYSAKVSIEKPIHMVFSNFMKIDSVKNWIPDIKSVKAIHKNPKVIGNTYNIVVLNQGQEIAMTERIMSYVPNEKVTLFFDAENMLKKDDYFFTEENGFTTVTLNASCQSESFLMACMFPYFKGTFQAQDQSYLNNFKTFLEKK